MTKVRHYDVKATRDNGWYAWLRTTSLDSALQWITNRRAEGYKYITLTSFT